MYCCFKQQRKLLPTRHLFQFYKCNKYLSTRLHTCLTTNGAGRFTGLQMYELRTLCLFSIWAGQSLRKYVLSRRAATDQTAAHVVSMEALSRNAAPQLTHFTLLQIPWCKVRGVQSYSWIILCYENQRIQWNYNRDKFNDSEYDV